jgi:hypothetical protein
MVWMVLPPIIGTRKMVALTTLLLILPVLGWGLRVQNPTCALLGAAGPGVPRRHRRRRLLRLHALDVLLLPARMQGTALGLQAGIGNFGVSLVQLLTPWLIGFGMFSGSSALAADGWPASRTSPSGTRTRRSSTSRSSSSAPSGPGSLLRRCRSRPTSAAVRHLPQPGHLVDDAALHHDLRHVLGAVGAVRPAHDQPLRRGQRGHRRGHRRDRDLLVEGYTPCPTR